jgi:FtsP/CotA-like multicopper oxidase with cupredoxin domain
MTTINAPSDLFPSDIEDLPAAERPRSFDLSEGDRLDLLIAPVAKRIGDLTVRMLGYGGSVPGPTLRVAQGTQLTVDVRNEGDLEATVHWHGLRLDNRYDGTTETQAPMPVGGRFTYRLDFPDPGVYWYHPHIREDYGQELGLYGNIVVAPREPDYWPPAHRELTLTLDDLLLEDGRVAPFRRSTSSYTAMGRFGNVLLVNGEPDLTLDARYGEVVRFYLTNTANTRVFQVGVRGARMKLVGGDSGRYEREQMVETVVLAPSERAVIDVLFDEPGTATFEHRTPQRTYTLTTVLIADEQAEPPLFAEFARLRTNADLVEERARIAPHRDRAPDKTLALVAEMDLGTPSLPAGATLEYFCPMHAGVRSDEPGKCDLCGMKLVARIAGTSTTVELHDHADTAAHAHDDAAGAHAHDAGGIEWEDDMVDINRTTTPANTRWKLVDQDTDAEGAAIDWRFRVGDQVKIRLVNEMDSDHPMHHPVHIHGAGRFLVLARNGVADANLVWKDTVLVRTGETVDLLLDVTHAGRWMAHCHIAEHHESGMMLSFDVDP